MPVTEAEVQAILNDAETKVDDAFTSAKDAIAAAVGALAVLQSGTPYADVTPGYVVPSAVMVQPQDPNLVTNKHEADIDNAWSEAKKLKVDNSPSVTDESVYDEILGKTKEPPDFSSEGITVPAVPTAVKPDAWTAPDVPSALPLDLVLSIPDEPTDEFPDAPTVSLNVTIPNPPTLNTISFNETLPPDNLIPPTNTGLNWNEQVYLSDLLDAIKAKLLYDVENGGTGLAPAVETAIWERGTEREALAYTEAEDRAASAWSKRGFTLPDGVLVAEFEKINLEYQYSTVDKSRDIMIKQADLAQKNTHFAIEQGINLENILIAHHDRVMDRALLAAKSVIEIAIAVFNTHVAYYNARVARVSAAVAIYESQVRADMLRIEQYKALIDAEKMKLGVEELKVSVYRTNVDAVAAIYNAYRTRIAALSERVNIERVKVELFRTQIEAYSAQISARAADINRYRAELEGDATLVDMYAKQVQAFLSKVEAIKVSNQSLFEQANTYATKDKIMISKYEAELEAFAKESQVVLEKVRAALDEYRADTDSYRASVSFEEAKSRINMAAAEVLSHQSQGINQLHLEQAKTNLSAFIESARIVFGGQAGIADMYTRVASSAQQAYNAIISIGSNEVTTSS